MSKFSLKVIYNDGIIFVLFSDKKIIDIIIGNDHNIIFVRQSFHKCNECNNIQCINCYLHSENRPAIIDFINNTKYYYLHGKEFSKQEFFIKRIEAL